METNQLTKPGESVPPFVRARQAQHIVEHFWLCDECAKRWTLVYDNDHGVALAPLGVRKPAAAIAAAAGANHSAA